MQLIFLRHGQSEANQLKIIANRGWEYPLTTLGRSQAKQAAAYLAGEALIAVYSSPLMRAVETAEILAQGFNLEVQVTKSLCEFDCGEMEGRSDAEAWKSHYAVSQRWQSGEKQSRITGGESLQDVLNRFLPFITGLSENHPAQSKILLVGHGGLYRHVLPELCKNITTLYSAGHELKNTDIVRVENWSDGWWCTQWAKDILPYWKRS